MNSFLGIDTSNYTTSVAVYMEDGTDAHKREILPVKQGCLGLRQSDAVFHHVNTLPRVIESVMSKNKSTVTAVGVSSSPRDEEGSYMPCFTVGTSVAKVLGSALDVPVYEFSHQAGHVAAGLYSAQRLDMINNRFLAVHVSGGTTEALLVEPSKEKVIKCNVVAKTLDLKAGQLIDRVGVMLGTGFPAGKEVEKLACGYNEQVRVNATVKGKDGCFSGIQNICETMKSRGESKEKTAKVCIEYVSKTLELMYKAVKKEYGELPTLFVGGVMSNSIIRANFESKYNVVFAKPEYASDNAVGISILSAIKAGDYGRN